MPLWLLNIGGFLRGVPWQVYVIAGLLAMNPVSYCKGRSAGIEYADAKWEAASAKLKAKANKSAGKADAKQIKSVTEYAEQVQQEKENIDEAEASGDSTFDVLFPSSVSDDTGS